MRPTSGCLWTSAQRAGNESGGAFVLPGCVFFSVAYLINFPFTFTFFSWKFRMSDLSTSPFSASMSMFSKVKLVSSYWSEPSTSKNVLHFRVMLRIVTWSAYDFGISFCPFKSKNCVHGRTRIQLLASPFTSSTVM